MCSSHGRPDLTVAELAKHLLSEVASVRWAFEEHSVLWPMLFNPTGDQRIPGLAGFGKGQPVDQRINTDIISL